MSIFKFRSKLSVAVDGTSASATLRKMRGYIVGVVTNLPNYTNDVTGTVTIADTDVTLYSKASLARSICTPDMGLSVPVRSDSVTVTLTLSGVPGGETPADAYVSVFLEE